jgi:hypothetical protein
MNIRALETYVEQKNNWERLFKQPELSLLNAEDRQRIADSIDMDLSPENLSCDGELSRTQIQQRYAFLCRCARELQSIDSSVSFREYAE